MSNVSIFFNTRHPNGLLKNHAIGSEAGRWLLEALQSAVSGKNQSDGLMWAANEDNTALDADALHGQALAAAFIDTATMSGDVGVTLGNSISVVVAAGSYATGTLAATALAAAINADATANRKVTATNLEMTMTLATVLAGTQVSVCGVMFTAQAGAPADVGRFNISGNDTADALSLAQAINRHPSLALRYRAWSTGAVVHIVRTTALGLDTGNRAAGLKFEGLFKPSPGSTISIGNAKPTASAYCTVLCAVPGDIGNGMPLAASGTGVTAYTNGTAGYLGQGTGGGTVPYLVVP